MPDATILPFLSRADLAARAVAKDDAAREATVASASDAGLAAVAALLSAQGGDDEAAEAALWGVIQGALHSLAARGAITDRRETLERVEEALAPVLPGRWIVAR